MNITLQETLREWHKKIKALGPDLAYPDDPYIIITLEEAIEAALEGNGGVGSALVNENGTVLLRGRNRMFYPHFRSDLHAEMDLLTRFEESYPDRSLKGYTLYSSLEPCEMCLIRIIYSGVSQVFFAAGDAEKGRITGPMALAPQWKNLAQTQEFGLARCSPHLRDMARQVFELALPEAIEKLHRRR